MNKYEERIKIIEYNTGKQLANDEKLQLAFEMQYWQPFVELLAKGTDGKKIYDIGLTSRFFHVRNNRMKMNKKTAHGNPLL